MDMINLLIANKSLLGISFMDAVIALVIAFLFYLLKGLRKDMTSIKDEIKQDTVLKILEHQKTCSESNNENFARKDEITLIKDSIDRLADTVGEIRTDFSMAMNNVNKILIEIAQGKSIRG